MHGSEIKRAVPGPGQESVWDYPRPPRVELTSRHIQVFAGGAILVLTAPARSAPAAAGPVSVTVAPGSLFISGSF